MTRDELIRELAQLPNVEVRLAGCGLCTGLHWIRAATTQTGHTAGTSPVIVLEPGVGDVWGQ